VKLNKSLADELNQPTNFPDKFFSQIILSQLIQIKKHEIPNKTLNPIKPNKPAGLGFLKKHGFF